MSLVRPKFPENRPLNPEGSFRIRGVKGFDPVQLLGLQDPFFARDPTFWQLTGAIGGAAANNSKIGIQTRNDTTLRWIVDYAIIGAEATSTFTIQVVVGGAVLAVVATTADVFFRNRSQQEQSSRATRTGDLAIVDNGVVGGGTDRIGDGDLGAFVNYVLPIGYTLFASEQLWIQNSTVNVALRGMLFGRYSRQG